MGQEQSRSFREIRRSVTIKLVRGANYRSSNATAAHYASRALNFGDHVLHWHDSVLLVQQAAKR